MKKINIALAGNPNCGKTTLFNALTGSTAHVGNWPGVTVDKKEGKYKNKSAIVNVVDLPGIYSLSPYTPEEIVARDYLLSEEVDCIINIVDSTNLERNLYLSTQLLELDVPIVIALNMTDLINKSGAKIDAAKLEKQIGLPCVQISAQKGTGISKLMEKAIETSNEQRRGYSVVENGKLKDLYSAVIRQYNEKAIASASFHAIKMIEGDEIEVKKFKDIAKIVEPAKAKTDSGMFEDDFEGMIADIRYKTISSEFNVITKTKKTGKAALSKSDKADRLLTHKIWGIPMFLLIMFFAFHLTFTEDFLFLGRLHIIPESFDAGIIGAGGINGIGNIGVGIIEWLLGFPTEWLSHLPEGAWYTALLVDGIWGGVTAVLGFLPLVLALYLCIVILEDSGYMARVAFIMDRAFRPLGMSGKSFMPLIMCFGCAIPGIMGTKTLENDAERRRTVFLTPFFSCGAKLPIWAAFGAVFAHEYVGISAEWLVYGTYIFGIAIAVFASFLLKNTMIKGSTPPFIMELPTYHSPKFRTVMTLLWEKIKSYVQKISTIIIASLFVIWLLTTFNFSFQMVDNPADSILGVIANGINFLFVPLGFGLGVNGWKFVVAAITGLIAKEMVIGTMGTLAGMSGDALELDSNDIVGTSLGVMLLSIGGTLGGMSVAIPAMLSYIAFNLLSVPCTAAVSAANTVLGGKGWTWKAIGFWVGFSYVISALIFWLGVLTTANTVVGIIVIIAVLALSIWFIRVKTKRTEREIKLGLVK